MLGEVIGTAFDRRSLPAADGSPGAVRAARSYARRLREQLAGLVLYELDGPALDRVEQHLVQRGIASGAANRMVVHLRALAGELQALVGKPGAPLPARRLRSVEGPGTSWSCRELAQVALGAPLHVRIAIALLLLPGGRLASVAQAVKDDALGVLLVKLARGHEQVPTFCSADLGLLLPEIPGHASLVAAGGRGAPVSPRAVRRMLAAWSIPIVGRRLRPSDVQAVGRALRESAGRSDRIPTCLLSAETWQGFGALPLIRPASTRSRQSAGRWRVVRGSDPQLARQVATLRRSQEDLASRLGDSSSRLGNLEESLGAVRMAMQATRRGVESCVSGINGRIAGLEGKLEDLSRRLAPAPSAMELPAHGDPAEVEYEAPSRVDAVASSPRRRPPQLDGVSSLLEAAALIGEFGQVVTDMDPDELLHRLEAAARASGLEESA